jgi:hypothetical protein
MRSQKAATRLEAARTAQADTVKRIADVDAARAKAILDEDDVGARKLDAQLEELRRDARIGADRIKLLEEQARQEEVEAVLKRRKDHVARFTKKLSDADQVADELQACIEQADRLFRRLIGLRQDAHAAWWGDTPHENALGVSLDGAALSGIAMKERLMHEIYRVGARPFVGGTAGELKQPDLPGGLCPDHRLLGQPDKIEPFGARMRKASQAAIDVMRGKIPGSGTLPLVPDTPPSPASTSSPAAPGNGAPPSGDGDQPTLAALLKQQEILSADFSEEGEQKYNEVVKRIAELSP